MFKFRSNSVNVKPKKQQQNPENQTKDALTISAQVGQSNYDHCKSGIKRFDDDCKSDSEILDTDTAKRRKSFKSKAKQRYSMKELPDYKASSAVSNNPTVCKLFFSGGKFF